MKNRMVGIIVCMVVFVNFAGALSPINKATKSIDIENIDKDYSHTILGEYGTRAACVPCYYAHTALKNIYANGWHPFYYVSLVISKNTHAHQRAINELGLIGYPTLFWDGDYRKNLGASGIENAMEKYNYSIIKCGERSVADIDLSLDVEWLGAVNNDPADGATVVNLEQIMTWTISEMMINITVDNNELSQYNGHLHVYVTDIESAMDWKDNEGNLYTFAFLDYSNNEDITISTGNSWEDSTNWDGLDYNDGYGKAFENITQNNTMVIATVFNDDNNYTDETAGFRAGFGTDPKTFDIYFGNNSPPPKVMSNTSLMSFVPEQEFEFNTTYYWRIDVWDALGNQKIGKIWNFTTRDNYPPNTPGYPNPANGATEVAINTSLSWTGGDPDGDDVTYDVYFGPSSPPPLIAENISDSMYDLSFLLDFDDKYYWKIVAWDEFGYNMIGPEWSFTTQSNEAPNKASDPFPANGANNVPIEAILNWTGNDPNPGDPLTYDVYFGVTNPPTQKSWNQSYNFFDPFPDMEEFKDYFWRIDTWDSQGLKAKGDIWSFSTGINNEPDDPEIDGPSSGTLEKNYTYTFYSEDLDGDNVSYYIEWGDGNITGWTAYQLPGLPGYIENHSWSEQGTYVIRAKAKDIWGYESGWTTFEVAIPKNKPFNSDINLMRWLLERFPNAFPILRHMLWL